MSITDLAVSSECAASRDTATALTGESMKPEPGAYAYDNDFFSYIEEGARRSAQVIVPLLAKSFHIDSVLDVGCGRGG